MFLISKKTNKNFAHIQCEHCNLDTSLLMLKSIDYDEKFILFDYDFNECSYLNNLNLPFKAEKMLLIIKLTPKDIHTTIILTPSDSVVGTQEYENIVGDVEFNVNLSDNEKLNLITHIANIVFENSLKKFD